jgi:hypothetical protein
MTSSACMTSYWTLKHRKRYSKCLSVRDVCREDDDTRVCNHGPKIYIGYNSDPSVLFMNVWLKWLWGTDATCLISFLCDAYWVSHRFYVTCAECVRNSMRCELVSHQLNVMWDWWLQNSMWCDIRISLILCDMSWVSQKFCLWCDVIFGSH